MKSWVCFEFLNFCKFRNIHLRRDLVEISGGLGPTAGQVWRIGLLGRNACDSAVDRVLRSLGAALETPRGKL